MNRQQFRKYGSPKFYIWLCFLLILFLSLGCENGLTQPGKKPKTITNKMQIKGKVSIKGSEPHTYLCLSTDSGIDYRLTGELKEMIWVQFQQEMMTLEGVVSKKALGPGFPAEFIVQKIVNPASK